jgi:hypothetical protein
MSAIVLNNRLELSSTANRALNAAARFWFVVAVAGQWIFAYYIAAVYGGSAARGDWAPWAKHGYAPGNTMGNTALIAHLLFAATISLSGALQLIPQLRARLPLFHRWNGRVYILTAFVMGITGLYLVWARKFVGDGTQRIGVSINALLILIFAALALRTAMARDFKSHRRWALRLFLVVGGVWFFRVGLMFWVFINRGPVGFNPKTFEGPFLTFMVFAQYVLPLVVLEIYLHTQARSGSLGRFATAALLFVMTLAMGIGIFVATLGMWLPKIKGATNQRKPAASHSAFIAPRTSGLFLTEGRA